MNTDCEFTGKFEDLLGKTLLEASHDKEDEVLKFRTEDGTFILHHDQSCCEAVYIESLVGDLQDLVGTPLTLCEEVTNEKQPPKLDYYDEDHQWTFYKMATVKGYVDIRWYGSSNGYYSTDVSFDKLK